MYIYVYPPIFCSGSGDQRRLHGLRVNPRVQRDQGIGLTDSVNNEIVAVLVLTLFFLVFSFFLLRGPTPTARACAGCCGASTHERARGEGSLGRGGGVICRCSAG